MLDEKELSRQDIAKTLRISPSTLANWEADRREPDTDMVNRLAEYFGVSTDYLLGRTDERKPGTNSPAPNVAADQLKAAFQVILSWPPDKQLDFMDYFEWRASRPLR